MLTGDIAARFEAGADSSVGGGRAQHPVDCQGGPRLQPNLRKTAKRVVKLHSRATGSLDIHFGEKLRARRLMMVPKVSQEELADALGVTFQQVQKYEKGRNRMSAAMMVQIATALKVDVQYFFDEFPTGVKNTKEIKTPTSGRAAIVVSYRHADRRCQTARRRTAGSGWLRSALSIADFAWISAARRPIFVPPDCRRSFMTKDHRQQTWKPMLRTTS